MEYYLPTYEECKAIVNSYDGLEFYESVQEYDGYKISVFNYRLVQYSDFVAPLGKDSKVKAFELRGITFVFNEDGSLYKRFLLMNKFFNLNQVESTQYDLLKDIPFESVYDKCDGSIVSFIELPNGKILGKSKMMVDNDQANAALKLYNENEHIERLVKWSLAKDITAVFEYVSPLNRVVLKYDKTELILLRLRDNNTGEYLELDSYPNISEIHCAKKLECFDNFNQILELYETLQNVEGCVVTLKNNPHAKMAKCKTVWYQELHHKIDDIKKENKIVMMILDEIIDDFIAEIDVSEVEVLDMISAIHTRVNDFLHRKKTLVDAKLEEFETKFNSNIKDFVLSHEKKDMIFHTAMSIINGKSDIDGNKFDVLGVLEMKLRDHCHRLEKTREFLRTGEI